MIQIQEVKGYSLKKQKMKRWISENKLTQSYVAKKLNLPLFEFKRKLKEKEIFNKEQISLLVHLVGAKEAYKILYIPDKKVRKMVYKKTFKKNGGIDNA